MDEHAFKRIVKDIDEGRLGRFVVLYGREHYLIEWAYQKIVDEFTDESARVMDVSVFNDEGFSDEAVLNSLATLPILSEKKITSVSFRSKKKISETGIFDYVDTIPDTSILIVMIYDENPGKKILNKADNCYDFSVLDRKTLSSFVSREINKAGKKISQAVLREYIDQSGYYHRESEYTLYDILGDVQKLKAYAEGDEITSDDINEITGGNVEKNVYRMLDCIAEGNRGEAYMYLSNLLSLDVNYLYILTVIAGQYEDILTAKELFFNGYDRKYVSGKFRSDYRFKKIASMIDKYTFEELKGILKRIYHVEYEMKTSSIDGNLALEVLIGEI